MNSIFHYSDHRRFLRDTFLMLKESQGGFSYSRFCQAIGLRSTNYLKLIIEGKRNLTATNVLKMSEFLRLNFDETRYFEALTALNQSTCAKVKRHYRQCLEAIGSKKPTQYKRKEHSELLEKWYLPAVLIALHNCDHSNATSKVKKLTGLSETQIASTVEALLRVGCVAIRDDKYQMVDLNLLMVDKARAKIRYKKFLKEQLGLSSEKLEKEYEKKAQFFSQTYSIATDSWPQYVEQVQELIDRFSAKSDSEPVEKIVQLNVQMFPLN